MTTKKKEKLSRKPEADAADVLYMNDPSMIDNDWLGIRPHPDSKEDRMRVFIPMDLSHDLIMKRLEIICIPYEAVDDYNEMEFSDDVDKLLEQIEIYDEYWSQKEGLETGAHSEKTLTLVKDFIARLEAIPTFGAVLFPFETIKKLKKQYGITE